MRPRKRHRVHLPPVRRPVARFFRLLRNALKELNKNDPLRMAGATAFFTTFALPPILVIIIQALGLIFDREGIRQQLFHTLGGIIGPESVQQVINVLRAFRLLARDWYVTALGFLFLVFVATTLFAVIKNSVNQIWKIRVIRERRLKTQLWERGRSVAVILLAGLLFVIGLVAETAQAFLGSYIREFSPTAAVYFNGVLSYLLSIIIVTVWFAILFRYLPDGRPDWRVAFTGAFVTSILFNIGKVVLRSLLRASNVDTIYGASGSIVLILLFVFYSSLILYYGTAFTKVWSLYRRRPIRPLSYATHYRIARVSEKEEARQTPGP